MLLVLGVLLIAESGLAVGVFLPAATTVLGIGVLTRFDVVSEIAAICTAAACSALGSQLGYLHGTLRTGPVWRSVVRRAGHRRMEVLLAQLNRRAGWTLAACQCFGVLRTVAPRLAAKAGVSRARHAASTVPAAIVWACGLVLLGRTAGEAYQQIEMAVGLAGLPLVCVAGVCVLATWWIRAKTKRKKATDVAVESC
ncbi:membrane-associated protein [Lentzea aerocolonigenes]|nr:membrane-associated protein [Lentzea aerocolonigenes]